MWAFDQHALFMQQFENTRRYRAFFHIKRFGDFTYAVIAAIGDDVTEDTVTLLSGLTGADMRVVTLDLCFGSCDSHMFLSAQTAQTGSCKSGIDGEDIFMIQTRKVHAPKLRGNKLLVLLVSMPCLPTDHSRLNTKLCRVIFRE